MLDLQREQRRPPGLVAEGAGHGDRRLPGRRHQNISRRLCSGTRLAPVSSSCVRTVPSPTIRRFSTLSIPATRRIAGETPHPLSVAPDAVVINSTGLSADSVLRAAQDLWQSKQERYPMPRPTEHPGHTPHPADRPGGHRRDLPRRLVRPPGVFERGAPLLVLRRVSPALRELSSFPGSISRKEGSRELRPEPATRSR